MTQFDLEQLRPLRAEIAMDGKRLQALEQEYEAAHWPEKVQEVREIIEDKRQRCVVQLDSLERWLAAVPDDFMREVLTLRYSEGMTWKNAAIKLGGGNKSDTLRVSVNRYLKRESA